jgi:hypothetical protein
VENKKPQNPWLRTKYGEAIILKMRKVTLYNLVTLDGFLAGPNGELDWHVVDKEFNEYANDLPSKVDAILFRRYYIDIGIVLPKYA